MDPSNQEKQYEVEEPRFLNFPHLPNGLIQDGKPRLNRYSSTITKDHDFPGAQVSFGLPHERNPCSSSYRQCCTLQVYLTEIQ